MLSDIWIRGLAVFALVFVVALGTIGGCGGDSGPSSSTGSRNTKPVLTENDFVSDPTITADDDTTTIISHLESPFHVFVEGEGDTGGVGIDIIPFILSKTTDLTVCWVDEDPDAAHEILILDIIGTTVIAHQSNEDCVNEIAEPGEHLILLFHDGKTDNLQNVYISLEKEDQDSSLSKYFDNIITKAYAQTLTPVQVLLTTGKCDGCDLRGADLSGKDLSGDSLVGADLSPSPVSPFTQTNLQGANLNGANLEQAILSGAKLIDAKLYQANLNGVILDQDTDFSGATAPNGGKFPPNSRPDPSGMIDFPNSDEHLITFINNCKESVWIGILFGAPAQPFLAANNNSTPPMWANCVNDLIGGGCKDPSWKIPVNASRELSIPFGMESAVIAPRTGCVQEPMCCKNADGTDCDVGKLCTPTPDPGLKCNDICVDNVALRCKVATCNDYNNCGTVGGAEPATTFEMSFDQPDGDFYNVSMVAANHINVEVTPDRGTCPTVGVCTHLPDCPWARVVQENVVWTGINALFRIAGTNEIGACLAPDKMHKNIRYFDIMSEAPFFDLNDDEFRRLGCVSGPDDSKNCGDPTLQMPPLQFYGCSPFAINEDVKANAPPPPVPPEGEFGGCITEFGRDPSTGNIRGCTVSKCKPTKLVAGGLKSGDRDAYSQLQICDPYGQCDAEDKEADTGGTTKSKHSAKWPVKTWAQDCKFSKCQPGQSIEATAYLESVKAGCNTFDPGSTTFNPLERGAYSWQFDDPKLPGLSGALGQCGVAKTDYTVTFCS